MEQGLQVADAGGDDSEVARLVSKAIVQRRMIELEYYKANEDEMSLRRVEPYALTNGREGWYVAASTPSATACATSASTGSRARRSPTSASSRGPRSIRRRRSTAGCARARCRRRAARACWVSPERARWAREARRVVEEWSDGSVVVELSFAGVDWLVREILKEAGDAAVLEPEDAREAVREAVVRLREAGAAPAGVTLSRREQIRMSAAEAAGFLAEERTVTCATSGPRGWPHLMPLWYVLREPGEQPSAGPAAVGVDVRGPRRRCATSSATRARRCRWRPARNTTSCAG